MNFSTLSSSMYNTGVGFAGIAGAWWLPATQPFRLSVVSQQKLNAIGNAIFTLLDVVGDLYDTPAGDACGLTHLLSHKVPAHLLRYTDRSPVYSLRPDFQIVHAHTSEPLASAYGPAPVPLTDVRGSDGTLPLTCHSPLATFSATELEICPSAQGYAHAMQVGYELNTDLADGFARFLNGRTLWFVGSEQWSEFLFEQLAFCRALRERGADGRVLYDLPVSRLAASIRRGERWQPPIFGVKTKLPSWNDDLFERVERAGLQPYLYMGEEWPGSLTHAVVFRFGYLECFSTHHLAIMQQWQVQGTTFLNPLSFLYESKVVMAALHLPEVRRQIAERNPQALLWLNQAIPETNLLTPDLLPQLVSERAHWILKFAGFDAGNQAWGGRSLQIGAQLTAAEWQDQLQRYLDLPFPIVAQRLTPSQLVDIDFYDSSGNLQQMHQGTTRLRTFFLRDRNGASAALGSHLTVSGGKLQVSEATDAVQAPIIFGGGN
ncbi:MAG: hypothetical protein U0175_21560 [Caldilineaceae bacterium]